MFDLDGTLVNTVEAIISHANSARLSLGFDARPDTEIRELVGLNPIRFFEDLQVEKNTLKKLVEVFRRELNEHVFTSDDVYPGTIEVLDFLIHHGFKLAVATNKPTTNAQVLLKKVGLHHFFSHVQGSENLASKPSPEILLACQHKFQPMNSYMVGDRIEDILAGIQSGSTTIGLAQTATSVLQFQNFGADFIFKDMTSFLQFLDCAE
jgi:phosphoglycolate phosphatase